MQVNANGVNLWVQDDGRGQEVLLIHGLGTSQELWDDLTPLLTARQRVIRFDLRGFGRSASAADGQASFGQWARDAKAVLDARGAKSAFVVGHGVGAAVALEMALNFPQLTRGVVAVGGLVQVPPPAIVGFRQQIEAAERQGMAAVVALMKPTLASDTRSDIFDRYQKLLLATQAASYARGGRALMQSLLPDRLADVAKPTLVIVGQNDPIAPPLAAREIEEAISGARITTVPGMGHLIPWEAPGELARLIGEFTASAGRF